MEQRSAYRLLLVSQRCQPCPPGVFLAPLHLNDSPSFTLCLEREAESSVKQPVGLGRAVPISRFPERAEPHCKQRQLCRLPKMSPCWEAVLGLLTGGIRFVTEGPLSSQGQSCDPFSPDLGEHLLWVHAGVWICRRAHMCMHTQGPAHWCVSGMDHIFLRGPSLEQKFQNDQYKCRHTCDYVFRILKDHNVTILLKKPDKY